MARFKDILSIAESRTGAEALKARLPSCKSPDGLCSQPDDHYLSQMALRVFRAGLKHSLVDAKWPAFEEAFCGFNPRYVAGMPDEALEALMGDNRLIRHWAKIKAVRTNAETVRTISKAHGGFGHYLAQWPGGRIVELWDDIAKRCSYLGGNSGAAFLRMVGKDTFLLSDSVIAGLNHWEVFDGQPKNKRDRAKVQAAFNDWAEESKRPLCEISMILAHSVD
jgi:3-methyladenine DNA glycosylase Tag